MKNIYDGMVRFFSGISWNEFIAQATRTGNADKAMAVRQLFQQDQYLYAFLIVLSVSIITTLYYYFILNKRNGSGYGFKLKYWLYTWIYQ